MLSIQNHEFESGKNIKVYSSELYRGYNYLKSINRTSTFRGKSRNVSGPTKSLVCSVTLTQQFFNRSIFPLLTEDEILCHSRRA